MSDKVNNNNGQKIKISILMYRQDDPHKCTAAKLVKFKMANQVKKIPFNNIVLDPFSKIILTKEDTKNNYGLCALDCSWKLAVDTIKLSKKYTNKRKLPSLLAGNPINYAKIGMLSTSEALSGALYILGYKEQSFEIMNKFKWGHTFIELNQNILDDYSYASDQEKIKEIEKAYFPNLYT